MIRWYKPGIGEHFDLVKQRLFAGMNTNSRFAEFLLQSINENFLVGNGSYGLAKGATHISGLRIWSAPCVRVCVCVCVCACVCVGACVCVLSYTMECFVPKAFDLTLGNLLRFFNTWWKKSRVSSSACLGGE